MEEKGWETNWRTGEWAGMGGSIEAWGYVRGKGYEFNVMASAGAAGGGCLKALKWLRDQDPPCPWDEETCSRAARGGHLDVWCGPGHKPRLALGIRGLVLWLRGEGTWTF